MRADSGNALALGRDLGRRAGDRHRAPGAWVVWPVKWADTDPADLRAEHQQTYLLLVADSYAINGDVPLAQRRLQELTPDGRDLSAVASLAEGMVAERLAQGDAAAAARLSRLIEDTGLPMERLCQAAEPPSEAARREGRELGDDPVWAWRRAGGAGSGGGALAEPSEPAQEARDRVPRI